MNRWISVSGIVIAVEKSKEKSSILGKDTALAELSPDNNKEGVRQGSL